MHAENQRPPGGRGAARRFLVVRKLFPDGLPPSSRVRHSRSDTARGAGKTRAPQTVDKSIWGGLEGQQALQSGFVSPGFAGRAGSLRPWAQTFLKLLAKKAAAGGLFRQADAPTAIWLSGRCLYQETGSPHTAVHPLRLWALFLRKAASALGQRRSLGPVPGSQSAAPAAGMTAGAALRYYLRIFCRCFITRLAATPVTAPVIRPATISTAM